MADQFSKPLMVKEIDAAGGRDYVQIVIQYAFSKGGVSDNEAFFDLIRSRVSPEIEESIMSLAKKFQLRGREEGIKEGMIQAALSMLSEGASPNFVAKCTKMTLEEIRKLANNL